ncbi:MAG: hypothetical protein IJB46_08165 [Prevotella sp.]|nr:hypothetical protein [Prevotella sp.]
MKKLLIAIGFCFFASTMIANISYIPVFKSETVEMAAPRNITVKMIKGSGVTIITTKKATYDSETNLLYVDGSSYTVRENPYYGDGSKKGAYRYEAGGLYYFNL